MVSGPDASAREGRSPRDQAANPLPPAAAEFTAPLSQGRGRFTPGWESGRLPRSMANSLAGHPGRAAALPNSACVLHRNLVAAPARSAAQIRLARNGQQLCIPRCSSVTGGCAPKGTAIGPGWTVLDRPFYRASRTAWPEAGLQEGEGCPAL
ncbi:hypothetical protein MRX96_004908 [Rhipicephalus microplus]